MANLELEIAAQRQIVHSLARSLENLSWYDEEAARKEAAAEALLAEATSLRKQKMNVPTSLAKAERQLEKLIKQHQLESNKELKELLKLKAKIDAQVAAAQAKGGAS